MFQLTMQTCALLLGLVMLAGAREGRPFPPDKTFSSECDCEFLRVQIKEFVHLQGEINTKEILEAMELQEAKTATALQGVVRQMEHLLRDRDEAALRRTLDERLQRMEEGARALGKPSTPSPEREDAAAAGGLASLQQLERRVLGLEASCSRHLPLSTPQAPPATASASTPLSTSPSIPTFPATTPSPSTATPSASSSPSTSSSLSTPSSPSPSTAPTTSTSAPSPRDQQTERMKVQKRIEETKARRDRARAQPSPLGEALRKATGRGSLEEVQRLLDEGADVNYTASGGSSPLKKAAASSSPSSPEVVSLLLSRGADVSAVDVDGWSALHWAVSPNGNAPVVPLLLGAGAEVDARDQWGRTPLHLAAYNNNEAAVRALLVGGATKDLKCWSGDWKDKTPFDVARSDAIINLLRT